jgi:predicted Fe-Mo cluster-binding NifX family protein
MKIAVSATGKSLDSQVDERFGRGGYFVVVDSETMGFDVIENTQNMQAAQGAGVQAAGNVVKSGAECVLTGHCGPKAFRVLSEAGVKIVVGVSGVVKDAVEAYKRGELKPAEGADVQGHW